ncbi:hypothetical protein [Hyphomicrobium sp.]|uniref:hypothetical protein n=1 Tax=Hyphomicrobium sp. TaxID=82 RepID=UPI002E2F5EF0|nr:hypothetical protein [Hyphomicrobium sp.]HEX2842670.1 hypothetical protein [Hyphomicrobium sp.]
MFANLTQSASQSLQSLRQRWPVALGVVVLGTCAAFAIVLSDEQGRMDLPLAYSVRMTCEDDIEAALWRGGCERIAPDIAKTGRPSFPELYSAFVTVHHEPNPGAATAARFASDSSDTGFDVAALLNGKRYNLATVVPEFDDVRSRAHAEAVMEAIDQRDRALLTIGRAGLGYDALIAGALANLVHPGALVEGAAQYVAILMGTAKRSDFTATGAPAIR